MFAIVVIVLGLLACAALHRSVSKISRCISRRAPFVTPSARKAIEDAADYETARARGGVDPVVYLAVKRQQV